MMRNWGLTKVAALAYLMFNLYTPPCFAAIGTLITTGSFGAGFAGGLTAVVVFAVIITSMILKANRSIDAEYALNKA